LIEPVIVGLPRFPRNPILDFHVAWRRSRYFIDIGEAARSRERRDHKEE
jgi:hypothetical protein